MVTAAEHPVGAVVCVKAKDMKEPWCLTTSLDNNISAARHQHLQTIPLIVPQPVTRHR